VFRVVFIIVRLFNTFDIIDICVLCIWHDSIKEIYYYYYYYYIYDNIIIYGLSTNCMQVMQLGLVIHQNLRALRFT